MDAIEKRRQRRYQKKLRERRIKMIAVVVIGLIVAVSIIVGLISSFVPTTTEEPSVVVTPTPTITATPTPTALSGEANYTGDIALDADLDSDINSILNESGTGVEDITYTVIDTVSYKAMENSGTIEANADYALSTRKGSCYQIASLTYLLMQEAGYEPSYILGIGRNEGQEHAWVSLVENGETVYYDPCYEVGSFTAEELTALGYEWD